MKSHFTKDNFVTITSDTSINCSRLVSDIVLALAQLGIRDIEIKLFNDDRTLQVRDLDILRSGKRVAKQAGSLAERFKAAQLGRLTGLSV